MQLDGPFGVLGVALGGEPGHGHLAVVLASNGAGRTAVLVQLAAAAQRAGRRVAVVPADDAAAVATGWLAALKLAPPLWTADAVTWPTGGDVDLVFVDGAQLAAAPGEARARWLEELRAEARRRQLGVWLALDDHDPPGVALGAGLGEAQACVDAALRVVREGPDYVVRVARPYVPTAGVEVVLDRASLRPRGPGRTSDDARLPAWGCTLLSGGAQGAEEAFGVLAERYGVAEATFTFAGRLSERRRGQIVLPEASLAAAEPHIAPVLAALPRRFPDAPLFRKVLQSIWLQVATAGEVFAVGAVLPDKTVTGGTGFAVALAQELGTPVHVFDQDRRRWLVFRDGDWAAEAPPTITCARFAGSGTRFLSDEGRAALAELFERSFGRAVA